MRVLRRLAIVVLVLAVLLVVADRVSAVVASHEVADQVAADQSDCGKPGVDIGGFPFLTQAIAGRYDDVTLTTQCTVGDGPTIHLAPVVVHLDGVHLGLSAIVHHAVRSVPVDSATGSVTIDFSELDQQALGQKLTFSEGPNHTITVTGTLTVAGHSISAHGAGSVSISGGSLHISVSSVSTPAGTVDPGGLFDLSLPVPALPFHLASVGVSASSEGVVLSAHADHLVLSQ
jgi:hypothetical protein